MVEYNKDDNLVWANRTENLLMYKNQVRIEQRHNIVCRKHAIIFYMFTLGSILTHSDMESFGKVSRWTTELVAELQTSERVLPMRDG